jgi:hypothetical protein
MFWPMRQSGRFARESAWEIHILAEVNDDKEEMHLVQILAQANICAS